MRFFSARLNFDNGIVLKFDGFLVNLFQYKTSPDFAYRRSRCGLKAQQARSPGHRPGWVDRREVRPEGAKAFLQNVCFLMLLPLLIAFIASCPPRAIPWAMRCCPSGACLERLKATGQNCWLRQRQWQNGGRAKRAAPTSCCVEAWTCWS